LTVFIYIFRADETGVALRGFHTQHGIHAENIRFELVVAFKNFVCVPIKHITGKFENKIARFEERVDMTNYFSTRALFIMYIFQECQPNLIRQKKSFFLVTLIFLLILK